MSRQRDREEFVSIMVAEGMPLDVCREIMRLGARLHREAELQCSDEATDRDRVPCPGVKKDKDCICDCARRSQEGKTLTGHQDVTRSEVRELRAQRRVNALCDPYNIVPEFSGDPRGAVVKLKVPSGFTNDWGRVGVCVP